LKEAAHYGLGEFSKTDARKAVRLARELVTSAETFIQN
jgi:hypothetical protein